MPHYHMDRRAPEKKRTGVSVPKSITYDGKRDWQAFATKFLMFAETQGWTSADKRSQLCYCLEDQASEFFANLIKREAQNALNFKC